MAKPTTIFICQECGYQTPKWMGKCPECLAWGSFAEETSRQQSASHKSKLSSEPSVLIPITDGD